jgi:hypothetical protein
MTSYSGKLSELVVIKEAGGQELWTIKYPRGEIPEHCLKPRRRVARNHGRFAYNPREFEAAVESLDLNCPVIRGFSFILFSRTAAALARPRISFVKSGKENSSPLFTSEVRGNVALAFLLRRATRTE